MVTNKDLHPSFGPDTESEADVFGTWFARLGAVALLIGAAFGFKYGVDQGIIDPAARVLLGLVAGFVLLAWGEWSQRRDWPRLAQGVSGGGVALLYLSIWSAFALYGLITGVEAFAALTVVALAGGYLAIRYDSMALAVLSTLGGFGNAILIGEGFDRPALFGYIVILDCVVLGLAYLRGWRALDHIALVATWSLFAIGAANVTLGLTGQTHETGLALAFATVYFLLFMSLAVARRVSGHASAFGSDLILMVSNSGVYFIAAMSLLSQGTALSWATGEQLRGPVILLAAGVHLIAGLILRRRNERDGLGPVALGSAVMLAAVWVPVQLAPIAVAPAWGVLGAALVVMAANTTLHESRFPGYVLLALSGIYVMGLLSEPGFYDPEGVLLSQHSAAFVAHIASLYVAAHAMGKFRQDWETAAQVGTGVVASILTLVWLGLESISYFHPATDPDAAQGLHFTLTATYGFYAAAVLAVGIWRRMAGARYLGLTILGVTTLKLTFHDVWMLDQLYRTIVFLGLGIIFLACSVMYHRFKEFILEDHDRTAVT